MSDLGPCVEWTGYRDSFGYGHARRFINGHRHNLVHRYYYELAYGPIPEGLVIDHLCSNPSCILVTHLEAVTQYENVRRSRGIAPRFAARDSCANGHLFAQHGKPRPDGGRRCLECQRQAGRRHYRKRMAGRHDTSGAGEVRMGSAGAAQRLVHGQMP